MGLYFIPEEKESSGVTVDEFLNGLGDAGSLTVDELWLEFIRVCDVIGAKKYIKFGATKGEWSEKAIKEDIAKYMKSKAAEMDDIAVFDHNGKEEEYPKILYYCFKEIGRKGKGADDKLIRKVFKIKKVKKGLFAKIKKTVSKAAKTVTKSASKVANAVVKNPILSVASMATPIGPVVAAAKAGSATKMIASAVTPKAKAYKKKLEMNIKAKAKKLGVGGDIKQITISLIKKKETGQPIPADLEKDVTENQALDQAVQAANSPEVLTEQMELEKRIRERAARLGIAGPDEPLKTIISRAVEKMNIQLEDYLADEAGDDAGKLKEDVTEYLLVEKAKQEAAGSGSGNTLLLVGAGVAALVGGYFLFMRK